jgi:hypothetical protein
MVLFAAIRERLAVADVPAPFRGNAIALITAGLCLWRYGPGGLVKLLNECYLDCRLPQWSLLGLAFGAIWVMPLVDLPSRMIQSWRKLMKFSRKASVGSAVIRAAVLMLKLLAVRAKNQPMRPWWRSGDAKNCDPVERRSATY